MGFMNVGRQRIWAIIISLAVVLAFSAAAFAEDIFSLFSPPPDETTEDLLMRGAVPISDEEAKALGLPTDPDEIAKAVEESRLASERFAQEQAEEEARRRAEGQKLADQRKTWLLAKAESVNKTAISWSAADESILIIERVDAPLPLPFYVFEDISLYVVKTLDPSTGNQEELGAIVTQLTGSREFYYFDGDIYYLEEGVIKSFDIESKQTRLVMESLLSSFSGPVNDFIITNDQTIYLKDGCGETFPCRLYVYDKLSKKLRFVTSFETGKYSAVILAGYNPQNNTVVINHGGGDAGEVYQSFFEVDLNSGVSSPLKDYKSPEISCAGAKIIIVSDGYFKIISGTKTTEVGAQYLSCLSG